ncbi:MAG: GNAT family N-acetyltransferase [Clostridia bacterium]|nr:GNAT family N-acetyltransferase [Clostridia bacterium]
MDLKNQELIIRPFAPEDRPLVEDFFTRLGSEGKFFFNRGRGNEMRALSYFDGTSQKMLHFLAEYQGRMVGYVFLYNTHYQTPWLGIAVSEDAKGQHVGTRLMAYAETYAKEHGKGGLLLTTHVANIRGQALYEKSGYTRLGTHLSGEFMYIRYFTDETAE